MIKKEWHWMSDYKQQKQITMSKKEETIYCGSGKVMNPKWLKVTINPSKISERVHQELKRALERNSSSIATSSR